MEVRQGSTSPGVVVPEMLVFLVDPPYLGLDFPGFALQNIILIGNLDVDLHHTYFFIENLQVAGELAIASTVCQVNILHLVDVLEAKFFSSPFGVTLIEILRHHPFAFQDHQPDYLWSC